MSNFWFIWPLSLVKPDLTQEIENKQSKQKQYKDLKNHKDRQFSENDIVA